MTDDATLPRFTLGDWLKKARVEAKLSQERLGEIVGVSPSAVGRWERDLYEPSIGELQRIAFATDAMYLLNRAILPIFDPEKPERKDARNQ